MVRNSRLLSFSLYSIPSLSLSLFFSISMFSCCISIYFGTFCCNSVYLAPSRFISLLLAPFCFFSLHIAPFCSISFYLAPSRLHIIRRTIAHFLQITLWIINENSASVRLTKFIVMSPKIQYTWKIINIFHESKWSLNTLKFRISTEYKQNTYSWMVCRFYVCASHFSLQPSLSPSSALSLVWANLQHATIVYQWAVCRWIISFIVVNSAFMWFCTFQNELHCLHGLCRTKMKWKNTRAKKHTEI